jgi:methionyl-tRNA formyltransferase
MKTIFFGSSTFSLPFLQHLAQSSTLLRVVSSEDKPKNRGKKMVSNYVKAYAMDMGLEVDAPAIIKDKSWIESIRSLAPDLIVTASYGKMLPDELLGVPRFGCINIHPSLLPEYRGADPIFWQLFHGCRNSGVSIFKMTSNLDQGEILLSAEMEILDQDNYESLENKAIKTGLELQKQLLTMLEKGHDIKGSAQPSGNYFYARKINERDEKINWKRSRKEIQNLIRALNPRVGAYTLFKGKRIKIFDAKPMPCQDKVSPGTILIQNKKILVRANDAFLKIDQLKPEGKNIISSQDFINGYLMKEERYSFTD